MNTEISALTVIFTEFYYWVTVVMMFLIHVGFCVYEVGATRRKHMQHTLMKNTMLIPMVSVTFFLFGWWLYFGVANGPWINGGVGTAPWAKPTSELMGMHMGGAPVSPELTAADTGLWARVNGVFWAAFLLFSWTTASIISGSVIERIRTAAFLIIATMVGSVTWIIDAAWGWSPSGWMVQLMGYHDAYASGVVHAIAGGTCLAVLIVLGPRIGKFGPGGEVRNFIGQNPWMTTVGLFLIYTGFWGFYAACNIPTINIGTAEAPFFSATNIYLMPTTLSGITFNFILSLSGGLMVAYLLSKGDPFWTYSGGLAGVITASAGNDLYHPIQAFIVGGVGIFIAYKLHYWVEKRFKLDDAVGAVAVHGYCGFIGVVLAGFLLWGYPAAAPVEGSAAPWFGATAEGFPIVNPIGNIIGAFIMFFVLGFVPGYVVAKILAALNLLRVPREIELAGLDAHSYGDAFPYYAPTETEIEMIERDLARQQR